MAKLKKITFTELEVEYIQAMFEHCAKMLKHGELLSDYSITTVVDAINKKITFKPASVECKIDTETLRTFVVFIDAFNLSQPKINQHLAELAEKIFVVLGYNYNLRKVN